MLQRSEAQAPTAETSTKVPMPFEEKRIPFDAIVAITGWPNRMLQMAGTDLFPWEVIGVKAEEELGFNPLTIERVDIVIGLPPMGSIVPSVGALITLTADASINDLSSDLVVAPTEKRLGVDVRRMKDENYFIGSIDAKHHVVGTINYVISMIKGKNNPSKLSSLCSGVKPQSDLTVLIALEPVMPMMEGIVEGQVANMPPPLGELAKAVVAHAEYIAISADLQQGLAGKSRIVIGSKTEAGAADLAKAWESTLNFGLATMKQQMVLSEESEKVQLATQKWLDRFVPAVRTMMTPQHKGKRLMIEASSTSMGVPGLGITAGLLLPAIQQAREAARRMACSSNVRQCGIAMLNYDYALNKLPAAILDPKTGKPLLSWRVAILPMANEDALYRQFKLDEPWDSPHNIQLLDKMPAFLKCPSSNIPSGKTTYLAVSSNECGIHPTEETKLKSFTDGTSNSILMVEVSDEYAVPWTAPMEFEPTPATIKRILGSNHLGGFHVLFCDASVRFISESTDTEKLMSLFTRAGGEVVDFP